jgi:hypothetical protein
MQQIFIQVEMAESQRDPLKIFPNTEAGSLLPRAIFDPCLGAFISAK